MHTKVAVDARAIYADKYPERKNTLETGGEDEPQVHRSPSWSLGLTVGTIVVSRLTEHGLELWVNRDPYVRGCHCSHAHKREGQKLKTTILDTNGTKQEVGDQYSEITGTCPKAD